MSDGVWLFIGLVIFVLGWIVPHLKRNETVGIRLPWTLQDEENWRRTHRFAGRLWIVSGLLMIVPIFLPAVFSPEGEALFNLVILIAVLGFPLLYSRQTAQTKQEEMADEGKAKHHRNRRKALWIGMTILAGIVVIMISFTMLSGEVEYRFGEKALTVTSTRWGDGELPYAEIRSVSLRTDVERGVKKFGYDSLRIDSGYYRNDEFGTYTRYVYRGSDAEVVVRTDNEDHVRKTWVLSGKDTEATKRLYEELKKMTGK